MSAWSFFLSLVWDSSRVLWRFSWLMYRVYSLFISYKHLYMANILYSRVYSELFPLRDYFYFFCFFNFDIYSLLSDVFIVLLSYILFPNGISHRVDVLTQDRCVGIPYSNLLCHSYFRHVASRSKPLYGWSLLTSLILRLGRRHF